MNQKNNKLSFNTFIRNTTIWLYALCSVANVLLAFSSDRYSHVYSLIVSAIVYLAPIAGCLYIVSSKTTLIIKRKEVWLFLIPCIYLLFLVLHTYEGYSGDWVISFFSIILFLLFSEDVRSEIFKRFYQVIQMQNIVSLFLYFAFLTGFRSFFTSVPFYTEASSKAGFYYLKFSIWAIVANDLTFSYRLCGIFNEAGALGTICALLFAATYSCSTKAEKILLLLCVIFSFSMGGYILLFAFVAIYCVRKDWRNIIWLTFLWWLFVSIPKIDWHIDSLNRFAQRFSIVNGSLLGDNRTTSIFDYRFSELSKTSKIWFGYGAGYIMADEVASYKTLIVEFGIIGFLVIIGSWINGILCSLNNKNSFVLASLFMISLYQRPGIIKSILGFVVLFGGCAYINLSERRIKNCK